MKKLIVIDDSVTRRNPSYVAFVEAAPLLIERGWDIEIRSSMVDPTIENEVTFKKTFQPTVINCLPIIPTIFRHLIDGFRFWRDGHKDKKVYLTTGGHFYFADVSVFHFYHEPWDRIQADGIERGPESPLRRLIQIWGKFEDKLALKSSWTKIILTVSEAIANDIKDDHPTREVRVLANCVNASRFDKELRKHSHESLRPELGMSEGELSLLFVSQGHYARKGFWLAVKVLKLMHERNEAAKMYVLGGKEKTLAKMRAHLFKTFPEWEKMITLVGWTDRVPDYMAAADALFMPSYFEAFSLVEIEAAAMGLPLLLTPHHGSEMILNEGVNGISIPFDAEGIANKLIEYQENPLVVNDPQLGRALTVKEYAQLLDQILTKVLLAKNMSDENLSAE